MSPSLRRTVYRILAGVAAAGMFSIRCAKTPPTGVPHPGPVATITVTPNPDTLLVFGTQLFTAVGKDSTGATVVVTPTWSVNTAGSISASGLFTAGAAPGTATIRATSGSVSGSATGVVKAATTPAGALTTISLTPNPASVAASATQQFAAAGKDAQGNNVSFTPTWSVTGSGTITSSGLFTAGTAAGTATVKATSGSVSGTATVTVTAAPVAPVATIVVSPNNQTIMTASTLQFSAVGKDAAGKTITFTPTWSVSGGGTITSAGLFTAGSSSGTSVVRATSGSTSGSATVTVSAPSGMGSWTDRASMLTPRAYFATGVINGLLYAVGGGGPVSNINEAYDPTSNTWTTKASMPTPRFATGGGVVNNILYVVGGHPGDATGPTAVLEAYDPTTNAWTTKASMPTRRSDFVAGVVNGILYVVGGYANNQVLTTVEAYDPVTNTWTTKAPLPTPRSAFGAAAVVNGILYVVDEATVEAYDPATNTWTSRAAAMLTPRTRFCVGTLNGLVYALGGDAGGNGGARTVEAYDPATNRWTARADMHYGRESCGAESVAGRLFVVGGTVQGHTIEVTEAFQP